jgi:hypothetical protein
MSFLSPYYLLKFFESVNKNKGIYLYYILILGVLTLIFPIVNVVYIIIFIIIACNIFLYFKDKLIDKKNLIIKGGINPVAISFLPAIILTICFLFFYNFDDKLYNILIKGFSNFENIIGTNAGNDYIKYLNENKIVITRQLVLLMPSFVSLYIILLTYFTIKIFYKRQNIAIYYQTPDYFIPVFLLLGFAILINSPIFKYISYNTLIIFGTLFLLQGLDLLTYAMNIWHIRGLFRIIIYIIILGQLPFMFFLVLIGLFDNWFCFMKLLSKKDKNDQIKK